MCFYSVLCFMRIWHRLGTYYDQAVVSIELKIGKGIEMMMSVNTISTSTTFRIR